MEQELKSIKRWIAFGAVGFFLIGVGVVIAAASMYSAMELAQSYESKPACAHSYDDKASCAFKKGKLEEVLSLSDERAETHPNDVDIFWNRAKVYIQQEKYDQAEISLNKVIVLAPSWKLEYVDPLMAVINSKKHI